ncbi:MAG: 23S rRNA (adenine(2503)-C(2))-methyltransferase RlmN [Oscillospiraceae bacterium]|nr:23S rRNA m2A2503 methyltransferase and tRNA A37 C2 methyltransferase [Ruminococcaceae bacterium BL-4]
MELIDIKSMTISELETYLAQIKEPKFRAKQIFLWLQNGVTSFSEMTNLSKSLRETLQKNCYIADAVIQKCYCSKLDSTKKYLFRLHDGELIESVLMDYHYGRTICISTQVGCRMGCTFCATGQSGFSRNLTPSEMLSQIQTAERDGQKRISNVVLMGMGEPLDNYENVLRFLELISNPDGINIGMRHISLSTCGIVDKIYDLAEKKYQLTLSISLHAPNDAIRSQTMPINQRWHIEDLLKACRYYSGKTGRRISYEYAMISGLNDSDDCARELGERLRGTLCHVNLIPVNTVSGTSYRKSMIDRQQVFIKILAKAGITATVRRTLGADINASCGQLRRRYQSEVEL